MAQIGTSSAGWYTDPSGQHRARYWDGASWTEQVRDDLTDPTGPPTTGPEPARNPVAETVAGVAEAVAAVAMNDPGRSPDPSFVVDYGSDGPWGATSGFGELGADPAGSAAATSDPFAPVGPSFETPVAGGVASGPAPGWYADPAGRHQARLWDGVRWTERVADHGLEGVDPLPGLSGPTTVDPAYGAWSSELVDHGTAVEPTAAPLSAGQASLASLPESVEPERTRAKGQVRPPVKVRIAGGFVLGGAIALLVGSTMTWMEVTGPKVGDEWTATGLDLGDGRITVAIAVVLAILGAGIITGRMTRFGGTKVGAMGALVAGAAALAVTAVDIADVADRAARLGVPAGAVSNVGTGLWVAFLGALFAVGGGLMAFANRQ